MHKSLARQFRDTRSKRWSAQAAIPYKELEETIVLLQITELGPSSTLASEVEQGLDGLGVVVTCALSQLTESLPTDLPHLYKVFTMFCLQG